MNIYTQYNIGDTLYTLHKNKAVSIAVLAICFTTCVTYMALINGQMEVFKEEDCFLTKEELLNSL